MKKTSLPAHLLLLVPLALALSACGDGADRETTATTPAETAAIPDTSADDALDAADAPAPAETVTAIDKPIVRADVSTRLNLVGEPVYLTKDDKIEFEVEVFNNGTRPLLSAGKMPVQLGITLAGPEGVDVAPGVRDFQRAKLPLIAPGDSARVKVRVPAKAVEGLTLRAELVQEGVAWWGKSFKQPTLDLGPFERCEDGAGGICDDSGLPLEPR